MCACAHMCVVYGCVCKCVYLTQSHGSTRLNELGKCILLGPVLLLISKNSLTWCYSVGKSIYIIVLNLNTRFFIKKEKNQIIQSCDLAVKKII